MYLDIAIFEDSAIVLAFLINALFMALLDLLFVVAFAKLRQVELIEAAEAH